MKGAVVEFTVPLMVQDMLQAELIPKVEDTVGVGFGGIEVVLGAFKWSEVFNREVFWEAFDREVGKIIGHSMGVWSSTWRVLIHVGNDAD